MALLRNVGNTDRVLRIIFGVGAVVVAVLLRAHYVAGFVLAVTGIVIGAEGVIAH